VKLFVVVVVVGLLFSMISSEGKQISPCQQQSKPTTKNKKMTQRTFFSFFSHFLIF